MYEYIKSAFDHYVVVQVDQLSGCHSSPIDIRLLYVDCELVVMRNRPEDPSRRGRRRSNSLPRPIQWQRYHDPNKAHSM